MRPKNIRKLLISTSMIALVIAMPHSAGADEIVVDSPTDVTVVLDGDDRVTVTPNGSITPPSDQHGAESHGSMNEIIN
ncbi:MAG: hypothetical protein ACR2O8_08325 [Rhizobiaceae bacterium]